MAKQQSILKLKGTVGGVTFYKSKDGFMAREKSEISASRMKNDPAFQRTRENGAEFGRAGKAGKLLRAIFRALLQNVADSKVVARLVTVLLKVLQADTSNVRGERTVDFGDMVILSGFEFNSASALSSSLFAPYTAVFDRATGKATISLASFIPSEKVAAPAGTTHFKITSGAALIDFANEQFADSIQTSAPIPWGTTATAALQLQHQLSAASTLPLVALIGIEFYQEVNGMMYLLKSGTYNSLSVVLVEV